MKNTCTNHSPAFKAKVALAAVQEQESIAQLAKRWRPSEPDLQGKREFIEQVAVVFAWATSSSAGSTERKDELLKKTGQLTAERDFSSRGLERRR